MYGIWNAANTLMGGNIYVLFWMFLLGSVAGCLLEGIWSVLNEGRWVYHTCLVWGPFCTIYGAGAVAMYLLDGLIPAQTLGQWQRMLARFLVCAAAGDTVEYLTSLFQEVSFGSVSWDYSDHRFNLFGRISLSMSALWGVVGLAYLQLLAPFMVRALGWIDGPAGAAATWLMVVFLAVDGAVSVAAVKRWHSRLMGLSARNPLERQLDRHFGDERLRATYPNMRFHSAADGETRGLNTSRKG